MSRGIIRTDRIMKDMLDLEDELWSGSTPISAYFARKETLYRTIIKTNTDITTAEGYVIRIDLADTSWTNPFLREYAYSERTKPFEFTVTGYLPLQVKNDDVDEDIQAFTRNLAAIKNKHEDIFKYALSMPMGDFVRQRVGEAEWILLWDKNPKFKDGRCFSIHFKADFPSSPLLNQSWTAVTTEEEYKPTLVDVHNFVTGIVDRFTHFVQREKPERVEDAFSRYQRDLAVSRITSTMSLGGKKDASYLIGNPGA